MEYYDYPGSVFAKMRDMIHDERMLKDLKYVAGHDGEVAKEMSKSMYRQATRSPTRDPSYVCCLPIQPGTNTNPKKISKLSLIHI